MVKIDSFFEGFLLLKRSKIPFAMVSFTKKLRFYPLLITIIIGIDINLYFGKILHRTILERRVSFILGICLTVNTFERRNFVSKFLMIKAVTQNARQNFPFLFFSTYKSFTTQIFVINIVSSSIFSLLS